MSFNGINLLRDELEIAIGLRTLGGSQQKQRHFGAEEKQKNERKINRNGDSDRRRENTSQRETENIEKGLSEGFAGFRNESQ